MTNAKIALSALSAAGSGTTFVREMIDFVAERLVQLETETICGARPGERALSGQSRAMATEIGTGRSGPALSS